MIKGDTVRIMRKAVARDNWNNIWVRSMDSAIGKTGQVEFVYPQEARVKVNNVGAYYYPLSVLELIPETPKVPVSPVSVSASSSVSVLQLAREIAVELGQAKRHVTADMVRSEFEKRGHKSVDLGNAAGNVFRGSNWRHTGNYTSNTQKSTKRRKISIWEYVGPVPTSLPVSVPTVPVPTAPVEYYVEVRHPQFLPNWIPSGNHTVRGKKFDRATAEIMAKQEQVMMNGIGLSGYEYRAVPVQTITPDKKPEKFMVCYKSVNGREERSCNRTSNGKHLAIYDFPTREEAQKAADEQNSRNKLSYYVVSVPNV